MPEPGAVFISYSHQDASAAESICSRLEAAGVSCWIAPRNIEPGTDWSSSISEAIQACSMFLLVFSSYANASRQVAREVHVALDSDAKKVIPLRLEAVEPTGALQYLLSGVQWLDGFEPHGDSAIESIANLVGGRPGAQSAADGGAIASEDRANEAEPPNNLPYQLTRLIGRDREIRELRDLVGAGRLTTVAGPAGIGKTRCALDVARAVMEAFPSGVWFVEFAAIRDGQRLPETVLAALGLALQANRDPLDTLIADLKPRRTLLLLDNCEHVVDAAAQMADAVLRSCREVSILATSRERLDIVGERVYPLRPLAVPSAEPPSSDDALTHGSVALFVERAAAVDPTFALTSRNVGIVAEICRRLDGIALALELAAARVPQLGLENLAAALDKRFRVLSGGSRAAQPRLQTLQATIDWSYDLLSPQAQKAFRTLGTFSGTFSLDASTAVVGEDTSDTLGSLVAKSLVVADAYSDELSLRYHLLESFRDYARTKLEQCNEFDAAMSRLVGWCSSFVTRTFTTWKTSPSRQWEASIRPELESLRSALSWTLEDARDVLAGQRLAAAARRIWGRMLPAEGQRWVRLARSTETAETPQSVAAQLLLAEAHSDIALNELRAALSAAKTAEQALGDVGDDRIGLLEARGFAAYAMALTGHGAQGAAALEAVLHEYESLGEGALAAQTLGALATATIVSGDLPKAADLLNDALRTFRAIQNDRGASTVAIGLAELEFRRGNVDEALRVASGALNDALNSPYAAMVLSNLAKYLIAQQRWDEARERAIASIQSGERAGAAMTIAFSLKRIAAIKALRETADREESADAARLLGFADNRIAELSNAARLIGFADARIAALEAQNMTSPSENDEDAPVVHALTDHLGSDEVNRLLREGREWDEARAISCALST